MTEAELLQGQTCCIPDCTHEAQTFDDMDNPMCFECKQEEDDDYPLPFHR